jgi:hypothetical protein
MAHYRFSIDLGRFIGARYITVNNEEGKAVNGIFIPSSINAINVLNDTRDEGKRNQSGFKAFVNFAMRRSSEKYISTIRQSTIGRGETVTEYNIPYYQACVSIKEEMRTKIRAVLAAKVLKDHPEWNGQSDTPGTDLSRAVSMLMPFAMGDCYLVEENRTQTQSVNSNVPSAASVQGYTPAAAPAENQPWNDDLPF